MIKNKLNKIKKGSIVFYTSNILDNLSIKEYKYIGSYYGKNTLLHTVSIDCIHEKIINDSETFLSIEEAGDSFLRKIENGIKETESLYAFIEIHDSLKEKLKQYKQLNGNYHPIVIKYNIIK